VELVLHHLAAAQQVLASLGVLTVAALWIRFVRWLPLALIDISANWRRFYVEVIRRTATRPLAHIEDRRYGIDRRTRERRQKAVPIAVERRSGTQRRQTKRRKSPALIALPA
jgi:hypothetical protein